VRVRKKAGHASNARSRLVILHRSEIIQARARPFHNFREPSLTPITIVTCLVLRQQATVTFHKIPRCFFCSRGAISAYPHPTAPRAVATFATVIQSYSEATTIENRNRICLDTNNYTPVHFTCTSTTMCCSRGCVVDLAG
jgi:hypothetical protein